jgi:hypothetical protein
MALMGSVKVPAIFGCSICALRMLTGISVPSCLGKEKPSPFGAMCRDGVSMMLLLEGFVLVLGGVANLFLAPSKSTTSPSSFSHRG